MDILMMGYVTYFVTVCPKDSQVLIENLKRSVK